MSRHADAIIGFMSSQELRTDTNALKGELSSSIEDTSTLKVELAASQADLKNITAELSVLKADLGRQLQEKVQACAAFHLSIFL